MEELEHTHRWTESKVTERAYVCGYCGSSVSATHGLSILYTSSTGAHYPSDKYGVYICNHCQLPTFIGLLEGGNVIQIPGANYGNSVENVPDSVNKIYEEARSSYKAGAYTGVILLCRTLLDHLAVSFGAKENQTFQYYVDYLAEHNYVTANSTKWVDAIRKYGNAATHKLVINTKQDAQLIIKFCEMLLKSNFEYPALLNDMSEENTNN